MPGVSGLDIESVLFDFDRTLVDLRLWSTTNYLSDRKDFAEIYLNNGISSSVTVHHMTPISLYTAFYGESGLDMSKEKREEIQDKVSDMIKERFEKKCLEGAVCLEGSRQVLDWLKENDYNVAVVSLNSKEIIGELLRRKDLEEKVDIYFGRDSPGRPKPYPDQIEKCLKQFDCEGERAVMVGDGPSDLKAANKAGVLSVGLANDYYSNRELLDLGASRVLEGLKDLKGFLSD